MTLSDYLRMPWTVIRSEHHDDGAYIALHIKELPGFVVAARSEAELERLFWDGLEAFISSYLEDGEAPPLPEKHLPVRPQLELIPPRPSSGILAQREERETYRTGTSVRTRRYPAEAHA